MPVFTAIAAAATAAIASVGVALGGTVGAFMIMNAGAIAAFAGRTLLTIGISKLIANRSNSKAAGSQDAGARIQLTPSTDNKLPVVYGKAFIAGTITDAKLSTDQKVMWYVMALAEHTDTTAGSGYTFGNIYVDNKLVTFDGTDTAKVISLTTNASGGGQVDTKINGNMFIYLFTNGSSSGVNTGGQSAITILSDSAIPSDIRWNSSLYTSGGQAANMTNTCFAIVKVIYNQDAGTTGIPSMTFELTNSLNKPGDAIKDYFLNTRYGCAIPLSRINTASLTDLNTYSDQNITYIPVGGGSATQPRYRINGPINTGIDCLSNLQQLVDACDSWLQYSELTGQWRVIMNKSYLQSPGAQSIGDLYEVNSDNLIGGIEVNPIDLNSTYNEMEVQYPNTNIKDQTDFQIVSLFDSYPSVLSPNEAINRLTIQLPIVNNAVQAKYLGLRRLLQGREDLVISFATDYSGIQVEAGDIVKVTLSQYGWTDKLFRINYVGEEKYPDGSLGTRMTAFEYNDTIYGDNSIQNFVPADNTGLTDPNIIGTPAAPIATVNYGNTIATMNIQGTIPSVGQVLYMDFRYGNTSNVQNHLVYSTVAGNGQPLTANSNVSINVTDLPSGNYWWSVAAKNNQVGVLSNSTANVSNISNWVGPSVTTYTTATKSNVSGTTTTLNVGNTSGIVPGQAVKINSGSGSFPTGTVVIQIGTGNTVIVNNPPSTPVSNANVTFSGGGVSINNLAPGAAGIFQRQNYDPRELTGGGANILDVTTTSTRNVPLFYPGVSVSAGDYNSWGAGTWPYTWLVAPSGLGYYTPNDAQSPIGNETEWATIGWYKVISVDLSNDTILPTEWAVFTGHINVQADAVPLTFQLCRFASFTPNVYNLQLRTLQFIDVTSDGEWMQQIPLVDGATGSSGQIYEYGYFIRNVTPGTNLTVVQASLTIKQNK